MPQYNVDISSQHDPAVPDAQPGDTWGDLAEKFASCRVEALSCRAGNQAIRNTKERVE